MSVNRTELVAQIAERADLTKAKADEALAAFQAVLVESLAKARPSRSPVSSPSSASSAPLARAVTPAPVKRSRSPLATV